MDSIKITELVIGEMEKKNISAKEMAKRTGLTERYIHYLKRGEKRVTKVDIAEKMLKALDLSVTIGKENPNHEIIHDNSRSY